MLQQELPRLLCSFCILLERSEEEDTLDVTVTMERPSDAPNLSPEVAMLDDRIFDQQECTRPSSSGSNNDNNNNDNSGAVHAKSGASHCQARPYQVLMTWWTPSSFLRCPVNFLHRVEFPRVGPIRCIHDEPDDAWGELYRIFRKEQH